MLVNRLHPSFCILVEGASGQISCTRRCRVLPLPSCCSFRRKRRGSARIFMARSMRDFDARRQSRANSCMSVVRPLSFSIQVKVKLTAGYCGIVYSLATLMFLWRSMAYGHSARSTPRLCSRFPAATCSVHKFCLQDPFSIRVWYRPCFSSWRCVPDCLRRDLQPHLAGIVLSSAGVWTPRPL